MKRLLGGIRGAICSIGAGVMDVTWFTRGWESNIPLLSLVHIYALESRHNVCFRRVVSFLHFL